MVSHQRRRVATANAEVSWSVPTLDPAGVGGHVVDPVRDGLAEILVKEVVDVDLFGLTRQPVV